MSARGFYRANHAMRLDTAAFLRRCAGVSRKAEDRAAAIKRAHEIIADARGWRYDFHAAENSR